MDNRAAVAFWFSHAMISYEAKHYINHNCDFSVIGPLRVSAPHPPPHPPPWPAGNALTDPTADSRGAVDFWMAHGMISYEAHHGVKKNCDFASIYPLVRGTLGSKNKHTGYVTLCTELPVAAAAATMLPVLHRRTREGPASTCRRPRPPPPATGASSAARMRSATST